MYEHINIFNNSAVSLLLQNEIYSVQFKENLLLNISNNKFHEEIFSSYWKIKFTNYTEQSYPTCFIQYVSDRGNLDYQFAVENLSTFSLSYTTLKLVLYQTCMINGVI